jgi:hypothetical protein
MPIEKIFEELSQSGGFESVNLSSGLEILTEMVSDICRGSCIYRVKRNNQRHDQKQMV